MQGLGGVGWSLFAGMTKFLSVGWTNSWPNSHKTHFTQFQLVLLT